MLFPFDFITENRDGQNNSSRKIYQDAIIAVFRAQADGALYPLVEGEYGRESGEKAEDSGDQLTAATHALMVWTAVLASATIIMAYFAGLVPADRVQLQQVIMNLLVNAVEAMSGVGDRSRELTIVSGEDDSNEVFVEVQDTGPGIDPADLDRLFQSFYTTKSDGIGMGLAISRSIIEAHGGRLKAAPNQPHGAVFRFTLPIEREPSEG
jgi:signal transduction histidine kinase